MVAFAKVIAHSIGPHNKQVVTMTLRYWRAIHGEFLTHRDFSRNSSSSRAIPVKKMLKQVWSEPAGPIHWGANRPGMQATDQLTGWRLWLAKRLWGCAAKSAAFWSWAMMKVGLHKQVANRVTEPYQYIVTLVTSTEWENFWALRRHKDAQPEMQELANEMYMALDGSKPKRLAPGQWHMPFVQAKDLNNYGLLDALKMCTARSARVSYLTHDGLDPEAKKDFKLHDDLVGSEPIHASPTEHAVQCMEKPDRFANLVGFRSYRRCVESGYIIVQGHVQPLDFTKSNPMKSIAKGAPLHPQ